jgi:catechol 2,3-dioxygenase-like lactoylglutathione lyase family enzyme
VAPVPPGHGAAPARSKVAQVRPRRLAHVLRFTPDVPRMIRFCDEVLGMRLSDRSGDIIAFMHAVHGSDHHVLAFAKSDRPGYHHSSWDVGSVDEVGRGSEQMRNGGYGEGWGVGRHVLGSNYFYYVRDPWNSWAEYSYDIDYVPVDLDWPAADHPGEDSIYVWGPPLHPEFIVNHEAPASAR